jgi:hypothetical protein
MFLQGFCPFSKSAPGALEEACTSDASAALFLGRTSNEQPHADNSMLRAVRKAPRALYTRTYIHAPPDWARGGGNSLCEFGRSVSGESKSDLVVSCAVKDTSMFPPLDGLMLRFWRSLSLCVQGLTIRCDLR